MSDNKKVKKEKKKINWKRTLKNNGFMLSLMWEACPGVIVLQFVSSIFGAVNSFLLNTYLYQYALNALQEGKELSTILITLGCMFGYSAFCMIWWCVTNRYFELKHPIVDAYIQNLIQTKAAEVDLACFESSAFYDTYVKATNEATNRAYSVMYNISSVIWIFINVGATGALIATISPLFLLLALVPLICNILVGRRRNRLRHEYYLGDLEWARQRDYVRRTFYLNDFAKEMRLTEMWKVMFKRMHSSIVGLKKVVHHFGWRLMFIRYLFDIAYDLVVDTGTIILAVYKTLVSKTMLLGDCFVVINSIRVIAGNMDHVGNVVLKLDENSLYVDNFRDFLEYKVNIAEDEKAPAAPKLDELELKNISFCYEGQTIPALSNVCLKIKAGEKIAIVGHNGAGKTTLIKLLQRLYDPDEGEILFNGETIKNYRLSTYRNKFGTVFQDYQLFATTVAENVMLRGDITDDDRETAKDALRKAGIYEKIETLERGVDATVTKEFDTDGAIFSGGEAQKISIARIFAGNQEIIIMDEPTSALDPIAEQEMYKNMFLACEGKTVIFISHRLSSATMADRIYMFEYGEIIEQGTHSELLAQKGKYALMWHMQADTYADAKEERV